MLGVFLSQIILFHGIFTQHNEVPCVENKCSTRITQTLQASYLISVVQLEKYFIILIFTFKRNHNQYWRIRYHYSQKFCYKNLQNY